MNIHEYQAKEIFHAIGSDGVRATTAFQYWFVSPVEQGVQMWRRIDIQKVMWEFMRVVLSIIVIPIEKQVRHHGF